MSQEPKVDGKKRADQASADGEEIKKSFESFSIAIVTGDAVVARILEKALEIRGGDVRVFKDGHGLVQFLKDHTLDAVLVTGNIEHGGLDWIFDRVRNRGRTDVQVIWFIGDNPSRKTEGHTRRPFRPVELLRPLLEALMAKHEASLKGHIIND